MNPVIYTDWVGRIRQASEEACRLLGISPRAAKTRSLIMFFCENRLAVVEMMIAATGGAPIEFTSRIRTLAGGSARPVSVQVCRVGGAQHELLEWTLNLAA